MTDDEAKAKMIAAMKELQDEHNRELKGLRYVEHALSEELKATNLELDAQRFANRNLQDKCDRLTRSDDEWRKDVTERLGGLAQLINGVAVIAARGAKE